jgi:hypothetical protein
MRSIAAGEFAAMNEPASGPGRNPLTMSRRALLGAGTAALLGTLFPAPGIAGATGGVREVVVPISRLALQTGDALPSWNDGPRKQALLNFVAAATDDKTEAFVPVAERIATFDMDGTLWIEMPLYIQSTFVVETIKAAAPDHPEWKTTRPFATVLADDREALTSFANADWQALMGAAHEGMTIDQYLATAAEWLASAKHPRFDRLYTELVYQPMLEVMAYLRQNNFRTYIVSGSGQESMRAFADPVFGVPPEQIIGTTFQLAYAMGNNGIPVMRIESAVLMDDNNEGKPQDISLIVGRRPVAAFGNSGGDQQMLEWTDVGNRAKLMMLVHHDDAEREYAYGPAGGLPDTSVGTLTQALMDEATKDGWVVVSMKDDKGRISPFPA